MAAYLFWEFVILIVGVWLMATLFFVYGWLLLKRQNKMIEEFLALKEVVKDQPSERTNEPIQLEISRNEPIAKYKDVSPDEVNISFMKDGR